MNSGLLLQSSLSSSSPAVAPFGSTSGSALDVIVISPTSSNGSGSGGGVVASSDFYVTFPSTMALSLSPASSLRSVTKSSSASLRSLFTNNNNNNNNKSSSSVSSSVGSSDRRTSSASIKSETTIHEEEEEDYDEMGIKVNTTDTDGDTTAQAATATTQSEHGTSCTEPTSSHPTTTTRRRRAGNVQIQINGRYIPQLDMIFSHVKRRSNNNNDDTNNSTESNCRFIHGNGLRPSTDILNMLVNNNNEENGNIVESEEVANNNIMPKCTCSEAIRNSEHHLCDKILLPIQSQQQQTNNKKKGGAILTYGRNLLRYTLISTKNKGNNTILATAEAHLYLWSSTDSIVVSDVDGTVTKSDVRGVFDTIIQDRFEYCHDGICKCYHAIVNHNNVNHENMNHENMNHENKNHKKQDGGNSSQSSSLPDSSHSSRRRRKDGGGTGGQQQQRQKVRFLYLSSRPISLISQTRKLLLSLSQPCPSSKGDMYGLPSGPILCNTGPLSSILYSELIARDIHKFKADVLSRQVVLPFVAARGSDEMCRSSSSVALNNDNDTQQRTTSSNGLSSEASSSSSSSMFLDNDNDDRLFIAGFGNKITDAQAYEMAGIDRNDIYIIDKESRILCMASDDDDDNDGIDDNNNNGNGNNVVEQCFRQSVSSCSEPTSNMAMALCCGEQTSTEWSSLAADVCCSGGVAVAESQLDSESTTTPPPQAFNHSAASLSNSKKEVMAASSLQSIELSLSEKQQQFDEETSTIMESLTLLSKTTVDIHVNNNSNNDDDDATKTLIKSKSKRARLKQTIRAFSSKSSSFRKFPSFSTTAATTAASSNTNNGKRSSLSSSSTSKRLFRGYDDPLLLKRIHDRMNVSEL